jgi:hypothetical protein
MPALGDIWAGVQVRTVIVAMLCFKQVEIGKGHDAVIIIVSIYNCWQVFVCRIYLETKRNCQGNYINGYG